MPTFNIVVHIALQIQIQIQTQSQSHIRYGHDINDTFNWQRSTLVCAYSSTNTKTNTNTNTHTNTHTIYISVGAVSPHNVILRSMKIKGMHHSVGTVLPHNVILPCKEIHDNAL